MPWRDRACWYPAPDRQRREFTLGVDWGAPKSSRLQAHYARYLANPPKRLRAATTPMIMASGPASHISMQYGIVGPTVTYSIACVSSGTAIGEAFRAIRHGYVDTVVAGGAEAQLNTGTLAAWA